MDSNLFFFYIVIIMLGVYTSYTDIKFRKIKNAYLLLAICFGLAIYIYLALFQKYILNFNFTLNIFLGVGLGLLLYFTNTWGAGDAKLFAVFCFLMPTQKYSCLVPLPSFIIFINVFLLGTLAMSILSLNQAIKPDSQLLNKIFSISTLKQLWDSLSFVICLGWISYPIIRFLFPGISGLIYAITLYCLYLIIYAVACHYIKGKGHKVLFCVAGLALLARFYFNGMDLIQPNVLASIKHILSYTLAFHCLRLLHTTNNERVKNIPFAPIIFLATLLANTGFLNSILRIMRA